MEPKIQQWGINSISPDTQNAEAKFFLQGMMNRMGVSYHKYGSIESSFPHKRTGRDNVVLRLEEYIKTGNTEFLIDAANYCLIEFLKPSVKGANFRATDSDESPGAINRNNTVSHGKDD